MLHRKDHTSWILLVVLVVIALMFVWTQLSLADITREDIRKIDVSGRSTVEASPNEAVLRFGYEVQKATAGAAQQDSAAVIDAVRSALEDEGVWRDEIETSYYNVNPVRKWDEESEAYQVVGYQAVHMLKVTTQEIESVGSYVDAAIQAGSNRFDSISFGLTDEKEAEVRNQALYLASQSAKDKALSVASGLGVGLGRVHSSTESYGYTPYLARSEAMAIAGEEAPVPTDITPGVIEVTATVSVSYEIA